MASRGDGTHVSVISAAPSTAGLWAVRLRLDDGSVVTLVVPYDQVSIEQVTVSAAAVGLLAQAGRITT